MKLILNQIAPPRSTGDRGQVQASWQVVGFDAFLWHQGKQYGWNITRADGYPLGWAGTRQQALDEVARLIINGDI